MLTENVLVPPKPKWCVGMRHVQCFFLFLAMLLSYSMRVNMSMAIVIMTDRNDPGSFDWSLARQSVILSSFFWGYVVLQIPGGMLAARIGGHILIAVCVASNALLSLLLPFAAQHGGWGAVCACRVIQGLTQGFLFPSTHCLIGKWVPLQEKSRLGTLIYAGAQLGTALQLVASGFLASWWGWAAIFYTNAALGGLWTIGYVLLGAGSPSTSKLTPDDERRYIEASLNHNSATEKRLKTPWRSIWTSLPFISLIVAHCGQNWGFWTLMTEIPSYFNQVLNVDIKSNGLMSALPYTVMFLLSFPLGYISDLTLRKKWLSITTTRKISNSIGIYGPALALLGLSYSPAGDVTMALLLLTLTVGLNAGHYTGYLLVHIDMAPNFAGQLMGITNCLANIVSIVAPLAAGLLLADETSPDDWRKVFYVSSAIYVLCNTFFLLFGTSERQSWNEPQEDCRDPEPKTEKVI